MLKKILYITYDGLTDPLGQSQILPYLKGLARCGYQFTILSFEKKDRYSGGRLNIEKLVRESGIDWVPLQFTSSPPLLSKFYDAIQMRRTARKLQRQYGFDMVHCRSYVAADVGLYLKKKFGIKFFFDMRGFWADEKRDGSWNINNPFFKRVYSYYKTKEREYIRQADYIISLTHAGKEEMFKWPVAKYIKNISVIPCCADMNLFSVTDRMQKNQSRNKYEISPDALVISYLGSIGTWYMLDEMLLFFRQLKQYYSNAVFLFVTHTEPAVIKSAAQKLNIPEQDLIIKEASRQEVPLMIKASDINISFIKPVYSKLSSSPTKLGEVLSMGIPVICNSGVGDVKRIVEQADAGYVIDYFEEEDFREAIQSIPTLLLKDPMQIRCAIENVYSLERGIEAYAECYNKISNW